MEETEKKSEQGSEALRRETEKLRTQVAELKKELKQEKRTARLLKFELEAAELKCNEYDMLVNSTVWKATKPLRNFLDLLRGRKIGADKTEKIRREEEEKKEEKKAAIRRKTKKFLSGESQQSITVLCTPDTLAAARRMKDAFEVCGLKAELMTEEPECYEEKLYILCCPQSCRKLPEYYLVFQTETVVSEGGLSPEYVRCLEEAQEVFVDSLESIAFLKKHTGLENRIYYLPEDEGGRPDAFLFYLCRYLLAKDAISFDRFYELVGAFVNFRGDRVCLSLPESTERRAYFTVVNRYGFEFMPGLRHDRGWTGCGLSYKFIMKKAREQGFDCITVCEDDVVFPPDFETSFGRCTAYLEQLGDWDIFQGLMADVGSVRVDRVGSTEGLRFVHLNHMISTVFNCYRSSVYDSFLNWDETDDDMYCNTIDRAMELDTLQIVTTIPFLVGHNETMDSAIWGGSNESYSPMIIKSSEKLAELADEFESGQ